MEYNIVDTWIDIRNGIAALYTKYLSTWFEISSIKSMRLSISILIRKIIPTIPSIQHARNDTKTSQQLIQCHVGQFVFLFVPA